jgi:hypothetical protein
MNKFDALKQFQAWPPEWQRLCAEYWIETGEDRPAVELPRYDDKINLNQPKTVPTYQREIRRAGRGQNMKPLMSWSMADDEALVKLHDTGIRRSEIIIRFMADHPYRTYNAVASRHDHLRRLDWKV